MIQITLSNVATGDEVTLPPCLIARVDGNLLVLGGRVVAKCKNMLWFLVDDTERLFTDILMVSQPK